MAVGGFAMGMSLPIVIGWMAGITPQGAHGKVVSLRISGNRVGQMIVPLLFGGVAMLAGPATVFAAVGAVLLTAARLSWKALRARD